MKKTLGVIGGGNMGSALIQGILSARLLPPSRIQVWDADVLKRRSLARRFKIKVAVSNAEAAKAGILLLAVKPQQMEKVLKEIAPVIKRSTLLISIAAGIQTGWIARWVGSKIPVVRVMPNTPALVGAGMSAICGGRSAQSFHLKDAEQILSSVGAVVRLPESKMDAVTALSGSGPAYFFYLMEQMVEAGPRLGLSKTVAHQLVVQTILGAAHLAAASGEDPSKLRAQVTSKGGTTEAALKIFKKRGVGSGIAAGIQAASKRARSLSK